jgi:hypothetical protein
MVRFNRKVIQARQIRPSGRLHDRGVTLWARGPSIWNSYVDEVTPAKDDITLFALHDWEIHVEQG